MTTWSAVCRDFHRAREGLEPQRAAGLEGNGAVDPLLGALRPNRGAAPPVSRTATIAPDSNLMATSEQ